MVIVSEGYKFIGAALVLAVIFGYFAHPYAALPFVVLACYFAYFFRSPTRTIAANEHHILSPADGTVTEISSVGVDDFVGEPCNKIVIFMSVFNVHVNRSPINGEIKLQKYYCGRFRPAYKDEVGFENEHHLIGIDRGDLRITVKQIAGILARRIVSWVTLDDRMKQGDIYGMIRFGSCLEIVMPERAQILVREGEKVQGGRTVLGRLEGE
ncbi:MULTISPECIES: phosphatidylserine decarboxylase [Selenomonas]|mgnify:FL=1|uniref:phosphatidylserine decarboxylase n=1 Tax=Selenomonas TaxID=970 RepID=UPI0001E0D320|nr:MULTISPECIES: phosphatidylserine decarboxylase [Selenomonas]AKT54387.1 phosphatidylserine decarboxylase [Selenomonas sp. oral taxon 478]AME02874.1 phosphatidylserine decarboxylase [Selenomonas sp. oral taxon 136]EFM23685.1 phosphatidylserine decarboxylase [Selenomonas sp. oral taxon 149 str. 67H29BP]